MENISENQQPTGIPRKEYSTLFKKLADKNIYRMFFGGLVGAVVGALYWNYIGCSGGSCPLTSNPYKTIILFTFIGALYARKSKSEN